MNSDWGAQRKRLDEFLVDNQELEALTARLETFNLFRVLRIEKAEIRHSNVLAWLFDPSATHGLGSNFLRRFLSRTLLAQELPEDAPTPAEVELMDLTGVEVHREWNHIDILVRDRDNNWCMLIENKIGSSESKGQLERYLRIVETEWPGIRIMPMLLTVEGDEPSEQAKGLGYVSVSHTEVLDVAEQIIDQHRARIPADAAVFLNHYLDVLRRITMQDEEVVKLCKAIYRKHREAIDLITEYGTASGVLDTCEEEIPKLVECEFVLHRLGMGWFLPKAMAVSMPDGVESWRVLPRPVPVMCWFNYYKKKGKLQNTMEVGPISDPRLRCNLLKTLGAAGFDFKESAYDDGARFTRLVTKTEKLKTDKNGDLDTSPEYIADVTKKLWTGLWKEGEKIVKVLQEFDWTSS